MDVTKKSVTKPVLHTKGAADLYNAIVDTIDVAGKQLHPTELCQVLWALHNEAGELYQKFCRKHEVGG